MATQRSNGGVAQRWVDAHGWRLVLCRNGTWLINNGCGRWRRWREQPQAWVAADIREPNFHRRWRRVFRWSDPDPWRRLS
jgi:hypothetical protein